jgi:hypothetical protein
MKSMRKQEGEDGNIDNLEGEAGHNARLQSIERTVSMPKLAYNAAPPISFPLAQTTIEGWHDKRATCRQRSATACAHINSIERVTPAHLMGNFDCLVCGGLQHVGHVALSAVPAPIVTLMHCGRANLSQRFSHKSFRALGVCAFAPKLA